MINPLVNYYFAMDMVVDCKIAIYTTVDYKRKNIKNLQNNSGQSNLVDFKIY